MAVALQPWQILVAALAGWMSRQQDAVIEYLREENRVLRQQLGHRRLRLTDDQRRRLAVRGKVIGRRALAEVASLVTPDTILRWQYVQVRLACSVGVNPTRVRVRNPVAWIALVEETKLMKSIDKAVHGAVSESPGRNASELIGGLVKDELRRPSRLPTGEGSTTNRRLTDAARRSGGVVEAAR